MPKYSIIVPVYKAEKTIRKCVDSILGQRYSDFELILVDDCSPDHCLAICMEYQMADERVAVIHQQRNRGVSAARNAGLDVAKGEYILFVDSDDFVAENYFMTIDAFSGKYDLLAFGHYDYLTDPDEANSETKKSAMCCNTDSGQENAWHTLFMKSFFASPWNKVYSKARIGDTRFDESCVCYEDFLFNIHYCEGIDSFAVIDEPLYYYRQIPSVNHVSKRQWGERFAISHKVAEATLRFAKLHKDEKMERYLCCYPYGAYLVELRAARLSGEDYRKALGDVIRNDLFHTVLTAIEPKGKKMKLLLFFKSIRFYHLAEFVLASLC